jgi:trk system potassium uptake protein TrkA
LAERIIRHTAPHGIARHAEVEHHGEVLVVGLGRFGSALASALVETGYEVLAIDSSLDRVQEHADMLTHVVQADATSERVLRQLGAADVVTAAVCIGTDIESSVLATTALVDIGVPNIWVKAITAPHGRILQRVGAHHVIYPEAEMGNRVAHLITGEALEYVALDDDFVLVELIAPTFLVGVPLGESGVRAAYKITVVCVKHEGGAFTYAERDTVLAQRDLIVVAGMREDVERFAEGSR